MGVFLKSDFKQYYDIELHDPDSNIIFERFTKSGMNRREMLQFLETSTFVAFTVKHGIVKDLYNQYNKYHECGEIPDPEIVRVLANMSNMQQLVVYLDEDAHKGEEKILLDIDEAYKLYPDKYASVYLKNDGIFATSYRNLHIGKRLCVLIYQSLTDWRSNCGIVNVVLYDYVENYGYLDNMPPLFAIDYVSIEYKHREYYTDFRSFAIDYNIAPGIPKYVVVHPNCIASSHNNLDKTFSGEEIYFENILSSKDASDEIINY